MRCLFEIGREVLGVVLMEKGGGVMSKGDECDR
jgi:hypothetical protein